MLTALVVLVALLVVTNALICYVLLRALSAGSAVAAEISAAWAPVRAVVGAIRTAREAPRG